MELSRGDYVFKVNAGSGSGLLVDHALNRFELSCAEPVCVAENSAFKLILIGVILHPGFPEFSNQEVVNSLATSARFEALTEALEPCTGRYLLIYRDDVDVRFIADACGHYELYYNLDFTCFASNISLLASHSKATAWEGENKLLYDKIEGSDKLSIGSSTRYSNVKHLMPNHYLSLSEKESVRFFPVAGNEVVMQPFDDAVLKISTALRVIAKSLVSRHTVILPVTAGYDSRLLLAAFRDLKVQTMIYRHPGMDSEFYDIRIAEKLTAMTDRSLKVIEYNDDISATDQQFIQSLSEKPRARQFSTLVNAVKAHYSNDFVLTGIAGEIGRSYFPEVKSDDPDLAEILSYFIGHPKSALAISEMKAWLAGFDLRYLGEHNLVDLFYWEHRMGIWGAKAMTESAFVTTPLCPINSRFVLKQFLSVSKSYRTYYRNKLFYALIENLDSRLLEYPFNPSAKSIVIKSLVFLGLYKYYRKFYLWYKMRSL
jgi:hypothetical protein